MDTSLILEHLHHETSINIDLVRNGRYVIQSLDNSNSLGVNIVLHNFACYKICNNTISSPLSRSNQHIYFGHENSNNMNLKIGSLSTILTIHYFPRFDKSACILSVYTQSTQNLIEIGLKQISYAVGMICILTREIDRKCIFTSYILHMTGR